MTAPAVLSGLRSAGIVPDGETTTDAPDDASVAATDPVVAEHRPDRSLEERLRMAIDDVLPSGGRPEPVWWNIDLGIRGAPIVMVSRDPRSGACATAVVFAARDDAAGTDALLRSGALEAVRTAPFAEMAHATDERIAFVTLPHLFHLFDEPAFLDPLTRALASENATAPLASVVERCEVRIVEAAKTHVRSMEPDGAITTREEPGLASSMAPKPRSGGHDPGATEAGDDATGTGRTVPGLTTAEGAETELGTKRCPDCAETILAAARICRFCRYEFRPATD